MNKKTTKKKLTRNTIVLLLALGLLLILLFLIELGIVGKVKSVYYGHIVRQAYHSEYNNLKPALEGLGLNENKNIKSVCEKEEIAYDGSNTKEVLFCGLQSDNYIEISESNKQTILNAAKSLDELTEKHGGRMQTNIDSTFTKYFTDIANGVDYNPDFGATFVRGNHLCAVHVNIAFANPKPPAYSIQFGCNAPLVSQSDTYLLPPDTKH